MSFQNEKGGQTFDFKKASEVAFHYSKSTGINCIIIDTAGKLIYESNETKACEVCKNTQQILGENSFCTQSRLYGAIESMRFGGKYIFLCPFGLVNWASPITVDGRMIGAYISGSYAMMKLNEEITKEILKKFNINEANCKTLIEYLKTAPIIEPSRVTSLSEVLFMISCVPSDIKHYKYIEEQNDQKNLSSISDYIQQLKQLEENNQLEDMYPFYKEKELVSILKIGDQNEAQKILNEILGYMLYRTGSDIKFIKTRVIELLVLLSRTVLNNSTDTDLILYLNSKYISKINEIDNINELNTYVNKIFAQIFQNLFNYRDIKHSDAVYKSMNYIRENYIKKITLEDVAQYVHFSPTYFSKIFKDETHTNFIDYLNQLRIEKSKSLLLNKEVPLIEISNMVGFTDQSYFSKVFKKNAGVTPGYYRKCNGNIEPTSELEII